MTIIVNFKVYWLSVHTDMNFQTKRSDLIVLRFQ